MNYLIKEEVNEFMNLIRDQLLIFSTRASCSGQKSEPVWIKTKVCERFCISGSRPDNTTAGDHQVH